MHKQYNETLVNYIFFHKTNIRNAKEYNVH